MKLVIAVLALVCTCGAQTQKVWIVAHRGAKNVAPENTIAAFGAAAEMGADYMEVDVRPTKDGELILMHDGTVDRTTNGHGVVQDLLFAAIRALDAGRGQRVPTFREALQWAKAQGRMIDVDHKAGEVDAIARVIREEGMTKRVVIEGPRERLARFAELLPGVDTMPKVANVEEIGAVCRSLRTTVIRLSLQQLEQPGAVAAVRECGARVSVTVLGQRDNEQDIRRVIRLGGQLIETDHPEIVAKIASEGARRSVTQ